MTTEVNIRHRLVDNTEVHTSCCMDGGPGSPFKLYKQAAVETKSGDGDGGGHELFKGGHAHGEGTDGVMVRPDRFGFGRTEYLIDERDCFAKIDVVRTGSGVGEIEVDWANKYETGLKRSFKEQGSTLHFRSGEFVREIELEVKDDSSWSVEAVQRLTLSNVRATDQEAEARAAASHCHRLGSLSSTRVVVMNDDLFPEGRNPNGSRVALGYGFVEHNWRLLRSKATWGVVFKLYPGVYLVTTQLIQMFMIFDVLTDTAGTQKERTATLFLLVVLYVINFWLLYVFDNKFDGLKLGGAATLQLRTAIMNKALKLSPRSSAEFPAGRVSEILDTQAETAVGAVWMGTFKLADLTFRLFMLFLLTLYISLHNDSNLAVGRPSYPISACNE